jgi:DNA excision repair protein ERCC-2
LPKWISHRLLDTNTDLSTDMAISRAQRFLKEMAQPFQAKDEDGVSTWGPEHLLKYQEEAAQKHRANPSNVEGKQLMAEGQIGEDGDYDMEGV